MTAPGEVGARLEDLHALSASCGRHGRNVDALLKEMRTQLHNTQWVGGAASRFRAAWESDFEPALVRMSAALDELGLEARSRAERLDAAGN